MKAELGLYISYTTRSLSNTTNENKDKRINIVIFIAAYRHRRLDQSLVVS